MSRLKGFTILVMLILALLVAVSTRAADEHIMLIELRKELDITRQHVWLNSIKHCVHDRRHRIGGKETDLHLKCIDEVGEMPKVRQ